MLTRDFSMQEVTAISPVWAQMSCWTLKKGVCFFVWEKARKTGGKSD